MKQHRAQQLIEEIQNLTKQYHSEVSSKRKPWPKSIKDRVRELFSLEVPQKKTAALLEIPYATIVSWKLPAKKKSDSDFHGLTVRPGPTVTVRTSDSQNYNPSPTVTIRTPDGYILEVSESIAVKTILELQRGSACF